MGSVLVTGGHGGLGFACTTELASTWHSNIILAGRSPAQMETAATALRAKGVRVDLLHLDVGSLTSVRTAAAEVRSWIKSGKLDALDAIVCNAGARFDGPPSFSPEGYESTFAVNHLGHFLLVQLLLDDVAAEGRVVFVASGTHDPTTTDGKMVGAAAEPDANVLAFVGKGAGKPLSAGKRYTTSKLCMVLTAYELDRRLRRAQSRVSSIAFDPGWIPETAFIGRMPPLVQTISRTAVMGWFMRKIGTTIGGLELSGASLAQAAVDPAYAQSSGTYLQPADGKFVQARSSSVSYDASKAAKLWQDSEALVHLKPEERPALLAPQAAAPAKRPKAPESHNAAHAH